MNYARVLGVFPTQWALVSRQRLIAPYADKGARRVATRWRARLDPFGHPAGDELAPRLLGTGRDDEHGRHLAGVLVAGWQRQRARTTELLEGRCGTCRGRRRRRGGPRHRAGSRTGNGRVTLVAAAATSQMPVWRGSQTRKLPPVDLSDEEEKAALRKQLIGSFLLE